MSSTQSTSFGLTFNLKYYCLLWFIFESISWAMRSIRHSFPFESVGICLICSRFAAVRYCNYLRLAIFFYKKKSIWETESQAKFDWDRAHYYIISYIMQIILESLFYLVSDCLLNRIKRYDIVLWLWYIKGHTRITEDEWNWRHCHHLW